MGGAAWRCVCRQQHYVVNQMTDAEKKEILRCARATVGQRDDKEREAVALRQSRARIRTATARGKFDGLR